MTQICRNFHNAPEFLHSADLKVIAFDCDGVIFDSKEANIRFYSDILAQVGQPPVRAEQEEYIHMHPVRESLRYLLGDGLLLDAAWDYCSRIDFRAYNWHLQQEPGIVDLLDFIKPRYRIAMATNRTVSTRDVLAHHQLEDYFEMVVSASDVPRPKPHPDMMEKILCRFDVSPAQVLYIGDSLLDSHMAKASGVFFAAYKNPRLDAHLHVDHFRDLRCMLSSATEAGVSKS